MNTFGLTCVTEGKEDAAQVRVNASSLTAGDCSAQPTASHFLCVIGKGHMLQQTTGGQDFVCLIFQIHVLCCRIK